MRVDKRAMERSLVTVFGLEQHTVASSYIVLPLRSGEPSLLSLPHWPSAIVPPKSNAFASSLYFFVLSCALSITSAVLPGLPGIICLTSTRATSQPQADVPMLTILSSPSEFAPHSNEARTCMVLFQYRTHYPHSLH